MWSLKKMAKVETDRRSGVERRSYHYTFHLPEKRNGKDRRITQNENEVYREKSIDELNKGERHDQFREK
jgi:hypothetical protein